MGDLIDTTEMYLKTIYEMNEDGVPPLRARIVERLGHSGPTVSQTVGRMERDGLLHVQDDRRIALTDKGEERATDVMRKHRLAELLLLNIVGLDWALVHDEACRWEHVMSTRVEERLQGMLPDTTHDPYGNPLPGYDASGEPQGISLEELFGLKGATASGHVRAMAARGASSTNSGHATAVQEQDAPTAYQCTVVRIGEPVQADQTALDSLALARIRPGSTVSVTDQGGVISLTLVGNRDEGGMSLDSAEIPADLAPHFFVTVAQREPHRP